MKGSASFKYSNITEECYCSTFSLKIHFIVLFICIICPRFPSDRCRSCPYRRRAPRIWVVLFGSDWDVWNKKKDSVSNTILMTCSVFTSFPPKVSEWMTQLKFWNCRGGDWVLNFSFSLAAAQLLCPIMAGTKRIASEINSPQSISILSIHASGSENTLPPLCLSQTLFQIIIFLCKKGKLSNYTQRNTKESGLEHNVPISWKQKFSKITWIVFTALQKFWIFTLRF